MQNERERDKKGDQRAALTWIVDVQRFQTGRGETGDRKVDSAGVSLPVFLRNTNVYQVDDEQSFTVFLL